MSGDQGKIERAKNEIHSIMERARGAVRMKAAAHNQAILLDGIDRVQEAVSVWDLAGISSNLLRAKDDCRKVMRGKPVDMVLILNELDSLEMEIGRLIPIMKQQKH
jgi:hypothetical protein